MPGVVFPFRLCKADTSSLMLKGELIPEVADSEASIVYEGRG